MAPKLYEIYNCIHASTPPHTQKSDVGVRHAEQAGSVLRKLLPASFVSAEPPSDAFSCSSEDEEDESGLYGVRKRFAQHINQARPGDWLVKTLTNTGAEWGAPLRKIFNSFH